MKSLTFSNGFSTSFKLAKSQFFRILGAWILWLLTIWIPYINVGTTIGLIQIQIDVGKGKTINPADIFNANHRAVMGKMFLLWSFMTTGIMIGLLFLVIPGIVLMYAWLFSSMLILDKKLDPIQAMSKSYEITYRHKWTIFFIILVIPLLFYAIWFFFIFTFPVIFHLKYSWQNFVFDAFYNGYRPFAGTYIGFLLYSFIYFLPNIIFILIQSIWMTAAYGYMYSVLSADIKKK